MLMKKQSDVSLQRGLPVEVVADSQSVNQISGETVQLYYYNSGVLTIDAGQAAGTAVIAKLSQAGVLDAIGGKIGTYLNTSFSFVTGTILTTEVDFPWLKAETSDEATGAGQLNDIVSGFSNGQFCIDYRNGIIYGKKATTGVSDTANYKVAMSTSGGSTSVTSSENITKVGGTAVPTAGATKTSSTPIVPVQIIDAAGKVGVNNAVYGEVYASPSDFTATYTSSTTITITGAPFTVDDTVCYVIKLDYKPTGGSWTSLINTVNGVSMSLSSGVLTISGAGTPFASGDNYRVMIARQKKAYDQTLDVFKQTEQAPLNQQFVSESLIDTTNIAAATGYYPSTLGMSMDGFKDMSLTGKIIEGDSVTDSISIEATNDEDTTNADWVQVYGYDCKNNSMVNILSQVNAGTLTFAWDFENFNFRYFRLKLITGDSTNTVIVKMRRKCL